MAKHVAAAVLSFLLGGLFLMTGLMMPEDPGGVIFVLFIALGNIVVGVLAISGGQELQKMKNSLTAMEREQEIRQRVVELSAETDRDIS
ncbi:hypothetical protein LJC20_04110 [Eubacteriales bacterium OttesenSCG-928-M02]|nr:hypothetical protein [Eubacteriales bacterium OttesenSCG-928-M02]